MKTYTVIQIYWRVLGRSVRDGLELTAKTTLKVGFDKRHHKMNEKLSFV